MSTDPNGSNKNFDAAGELFKTWSDAQNAAMKNWADMAAGVMSGSGFGTGFTPAASDSSSSESGQDAKAASTGHDWAFSPDAFQAFMNTWKQLSETTLNQVMQGQDPSMRMLAAQMRSAQESAFQMTGALMQSWQGLGPQTGSAGEAQPWQQASEAISRMMRGGFTSGTYGGSQAGESAQALWQQYVAWLQQQMGPIASAFQPDASFFSAMSDPSSMFRAMSEQGWNALVAMSDQASEGMRLGINRQSEERMQKGFKAWMKARRASSEYQLMLSEAWSKAFGSAFQALGKRAGEGQPVSSLKELSAFWTRETDRVMEATFASETYAKAQAEMLNTAMRYQKIEREIVDGLLASSHLASRSELDEAYRAIHELRREVRAMRREMDEQKGDRA